MKSLGVGVLLGGCLALAGCNLPWLKRPPESPQNPDSRYQQTGLDRLVAFGGETAAMDDAARQAECRHLHDLATVAPSLGLRLHLATLQSVGDACGSVAAALATLREIKPEAKDEPLRSWVLYQEQVLSRLDRENDQRREIELKVKQAMDRAQRSQREAKTRENQLKTLQDKLDALKSIEQDQDRVNPQRGQ